MEKYDIMDYLKDDKELQKAVIEEFLKEIAELKAENERLKEEIGTRDNLVEHFRKEAINWAKISNDCIKDIENYKHTLQEIKAIAETYITDCQGFKCEAMEEIMQKITKAEEE